MARKKKGVDESPKRDNNTEEAPKRSLRKQMTHTFHIPQEELEGILILCPISIKQEKYLNDEEHDIVVWGGAAAAGKTQLSLLRILLAAMYDKHYVAGIARKSQKQMKGAGSLWSTGCKLYQTFGVTQNKIEMSWTFPNKAEVKCHHLDKNQDDWQGTQCTEFLVDEAQQCDEDDVWYLTSRLRSQSKKRHQLRLTCNPLNTSFLCKWINKAGYLLESGLPDPEMDGVTTYMLEIEGGFSWFSSKKEIEELYGKEVANYALSFVFYSANVYDNPWIRKHQPAYVHKLENLKQVEKERLLLGNWFAKLNQEGYAKREWFQDVPLTEIPLELPQFRAYDLAATPVSPAYPSPDWTRGVKCSYDKVSGMFYILEMCSIRDRPAKVQQLIEQTAFRDGRGTFIGIPVDAGAGGKEVADTKRARLLSLGHKVVLMKARKSKMQRAEAFLIALQQGKVMVAKGVFSDEHYAELEMFDGKLSGGAHDDIMDCLGEAFTNLTTGNLIPTIRMNNKSPRVRAMGGRTLL